MQIKIYILGHFTALTNITTFKSTDMLPFNNSNWKITHYTHFFPTYSRFVGAKCEQSVCEDNPCQFGSTCVPYPASGFLCQCPLGKHGIYCEHGKYSKQH